MWWMAAQAGVQMASGIMQVQAQADADLADMKLRTEKRRQALSRETSNYLKNINAVNQQTTSDNLNIDVEAAKATDRMASSLAGSNLSGNSIDDIDAQIQREVSADRLSSTRQRRNTLGQLDDNFQRFSEDLVDDARMERTNIRDYNQDIINTGLGAGSSAMGSFGSSMSVAKGG